MLLNERNLEKNPDWYKDIDPKNNYLVLGDDMDSFLSCKYLKNKFGLKIGGFYDFSRGFYYSTELSEFERWWMSPIYIDICRSEGKCFDNHFSYMMNKNPDMFTFNRGVSEYNRKYNGGTLQLLVSLFETKESMEKKSEESLITLLCVDAWFKGVYNKGGRYAQINYDWFEELGLYDYLKPLCEKYDDAFFENYIQKVKQLNRKFFVNKKGYLESTLKKLEALPTEKFELVDPVKQDRCSSYQMMKIKRERDVVSAAETFKDTYQYSYRPIINKEEN
jgi:hypothetical protein